MDEARFIFDSVTAFLRFSKAITVDCSRTDKETARPATFRTRCTAIWHARDAADEGRADLQEHLQPSELLLGHTKMDNAVRYLAIKLDDALVISEAIDL